MSENADVITLSSDEEAQAPNKKRIKIITIDTNITQPSLKTFLKSQSYIDLSDEENEKTEEETNTNTGDDKTKIAMKVLDDNINTNKTTINTEDVSEPTNVNNDTSSVSGTSANCNESDKENADKVDKEFFAFLDNCLHSSTDSELNKSLHSQLPKIKNCFEKVKQYSYNQEEFLALIRRSYKRMNENPKQIIMCFSEIYQWLNSSYLSSEKVQTLSKKDWIRVKKLDKALGNLKVKLRELENAEIDWDDEEDSVYLQYERYSACAVKHYKELCRYIDKNPYQGRPAYSKLAFKYSKYAEINRAINKKYKKNKRFPTYCELDKLIRKCVEEHNLNIPENVLLHEIKHCFEKLGKLLQKNRKIESYQFFQDFLDDFIDPAKNNPKIEEQIKVNQSTYSKKLDEIFEKYSKLQETGYEPILSSDSDDSSYDDESDADEKTEEITSN